MLRMLAAGGIFSYLRDTERCFDALMVVFGFVSIIPTGNGGSSKNSAGGLRALKALKALTPLRTLTRFPSLKNIIVCFVEVRGCHMQIYSV